MKKLILGLVLPIVLPLFTITLFSCDGDTKSEPDWSSERPKIIIWVADDQYLESVGCYGGDPVQTPTIDKLAREGLMFTRAYSASSICTPARSALYTGMYPIKNGSHPNHSGLKKDIPSMPGMMKELGYRTAIVGKHGVHDVPTRPSNTFVWDDEYPLTKKTIEGAEWSEKAAGKHREMDYPGIEEFIGRDSIPFCLFVASSLPHGPELTKISNGLEGYPANNWKTDWQLRQYMEMLDETGKADNTLVIFVSDNGSNTDSSKYTLFEPGVHVPMIAWWPGHIAPGTTTNALADFTDVMPTIMELAGGSAHDDMDGKSLISLFKGNDQPVREDLYLSFTCLGVNDVYEPYPIRAVVAGNYKLIHYLNPGIVPPKGSVDTKSPEFLLYDLESDPKEKVNLYDDPAYLKVKNDMHQRLDKWTLEVGDEGMATEFEATEMFPEKIGHLEMPEN